ncbi:MAG: hybD [Acidobacteria bacterium]|nr:hybD [Acidobacteriota bacterium]
MSEARVAPVLVLGVGNTLLGDDGIGVHLVNQLSCRAVDWQDSVELLEGGTAGLALLGSVAGRPALVLLDAVALGSMPGTIHLRRDLEVLDLSCRSTTAHEGNAGELLSAALMLGELPARIYLVGIEPACIGSGTGLSEPVMKAVPVALEAARRAIAEALSAVPPRKDHPAGQAHGLQSEFGSSIPRV